MAVKSLLPNQHTPLHFLYGECDCCLCKAEERIKKLEEEIAILKKHIDETDIPCLKRNPNGRKELL